MSILYHFTTHSSLFCYPEVTGLWKEDHFPAEEENCACLKGGKMLKGEKILIFIVVCLIVIVYAGAWLVTGPLYDRILGMDVSFAVREDSSSVFVSFKEGEISGFMKEPLVVHVQGRNPVFLVGTAGGGLWVILMIGIVIVLFGAMLYGERK